MQFIILNRDSEIKSCVIFIHGFGKSSEDWSKMNLDKNLRNQILLITFNNETYLDSFDKVSHDIINYVIEKKLYSSWIIIGHSIGSFYAQTIAKLYPKNIIGLILIDSSYKTSEYYNILKQKINNDDKSEIIQNWLNNWDQVPDPNELRSKIIVICHINVIADGKKLNKYIVREFNGNELVYYKNLQNRLLYFKQLTNKNNKSLLIAHIDKSHMLHHECSNQIIQSIKSLI